MKISTEIFALSCAWTSMEHTTRWWVHYIRALSEQFLKSNRPICRRSGFFCRVEVARYGNFNFGRGLSEKEGFSLKNALMGTGPSLYSQYVPKPSHLEQLMRNTFQQETALISHHSASNFWLNFTGSLVATIFVKSHTYCIYWQLLFVSNSITTLMWKDM